MRAVVGRHRAVAAILVAGLMLAACTTSGQPLKQPSWPAPADPMTLTTKAGLEATQSEHLNSHTHAHLHVFVDGNDVVVPSGIASTSRRPPASTRRRPRTGPRPSTT